LTRNDVRVSRYTMVVYFIFIFHSNYQS
jgi:hypothetical protein